MSQYNHNCKVCGKGYNSCDYCLNQKNYAAWRAIACTQDHFQAYMILHEYGSGLIEKSDAKAMLEKLDIEGWENYPEHNRVYIAEILQEDEKPVVDVVAEKPVVEPQAIQTPVKVAQTQPQSFSNNKKPFGKYR